MGEEIENDREFAKTHMKSVGIPIGPHELVKGIDLLEDKLKTRKNVFVKARYGNMRGNFESFKVDSYPLIKSKLDEIRAALGVRGDETEFIIEDAIEDAVEIGYDGYCIDGQFPSLSCVGIEIKSNGYVGQMLTTAEQPDQTLFMNDQLAPWLKEKQYKNFFAVEARIDKKGNPWAIDPCCRAGRPPSELLQVLYTNLADIFWEGAGGVVVDPVPAGKWGAEIMIYCERAEKHELVLEYPEDVAPFVKLVNHSAIEGRHVVLPGLSGVGAVVAVGETMEEAIKTCRERADQVKGYDIDMFPDALDQAQEEVEKLKEHHVRFGPVLD
jgi:hypothetical protein